MWTTMLEARMVSAHSTSQLLLLRRLMGHRLSTSVHLSTIVHAVECGHISKTRQGKLIAAIKHPVEVGTTDFIAAFKSSSRCSPGTGQVLPSRKAQLWVTFYRSDDIVVSATMSSGIPVNTSNPPTGIRRSPRQFLSSEVVKIPIATISTVILQWDRGHG